MPTTPHQADEASAAVKSQTIPDSREGAGHPAAAPKQTTPPPRAAARTASLDDVRVVKRLLWILAVIAVVVVLYAGAAVFIPVTAALLLSFLFKPVVRRLHGWHIVPPLSAMVIMLTIFVSIVGGAASGADALRAWIEEMPQATHTLEVKLRDLRRRWQQVSDATTKITEIADGNIANEEAPAPAAGAISVPNLPKPVPVEIRGSGLPTIVMSRTASVLTSLTIMLVTAFFILASGDLLLRQLVQALPALSHKKDAVEAWRDLESHVSAYLATVTMINIALGLCVWAALGLLGLPNAMWWGVAAAVGNFIPFIGPLVVGAGVFLASLLAFDSLGQAAGITLVFAALTASEGYFITPMVLGRRLSLNPLVLFVWLVFWGWMWGVAGALMAVPMLVCFKIVCDHVESLHTLADVLSGYVRRAGEGNGKGDATAGEKVAT